MPWRSLVSQILMCIPNHLRVAMENRIDMHYGMMLGFAFNCSTVTVGDLVLDEVPGPVWDELKAAARLLVQAGKGASWMHQGGELFGLWPHK